jgi:flagellar basal body-associated protein FliL
MAGNLSVSGKFFVVVALVGVLVAGGWFVFRPQNNLPGPGQQRLGAAEELGVFRVNLAGSESVLTAGVVVHVAQETSVLEKAFDAPFGRPMASVRDAALGVLASKTREDLASDEGRKELKREMARAMNFAAWNLREGADSREPIRPETRFVKGDLIDADAKPAESEKSEDEAEVSEQPDPQLWDSQTGPVLKVYFTDFVIETP